MRCRASSPRWGVHPNRRAAQAGPPRDRLEDGVSNSRTLPPGNRGQPAQAVEHSKQETFLRVAWVLCPAESCPPFSVTEMAENPPPAGTTNVADITAELRTGLTTARGQRVASQPTDAV